MESITLIILQIFFATHAVFKNWVMSVESAVLDGEYLMDYNII